jgi:AraC-like DNA-binding protein
MVWLSIENTIRQNLTDMQFCVSRLALLLDISPSYLREVVHRHFKTTPQKLIQKHRIEYAVILLTNLEKVQNVSRIVGYGTSRAFRNAFYKERGITPREFKRQIRRSASPKSDKKTSAGHRQNRRSAGSTPNRNKEIPTLSVANR